MHDTGSAADATRLMNRFETAFVNNGLRALVQRWVEATVLLRLGGRLDGGTALEIGCGRGEGARIVRERFGAARVVGVDIDSRQIARAAKRCDAALHVADAAALPFADASFDGVFTFGALHEVPDWRRALGEVARVLRPGGRFYFEEALRGFLSTRLMRRLFPSIPGAGRFDAGELERACAEAHMPLAAPLVRFGPMFACGVARRGG